MGTMNKILIFLGIASVIFITLCFIFVWHEKPLPDTLILSFFTALGTEGMVMGWIKNVKEKTNGNNK